MAEKSVTIASDKYGVKVSQIRTLKRGLRNPQALMKQIGFLVAEQARESFSKQGLGDLKWKPRYPGQKPPVLNIAGSLQDFNSGKKRPKAIRFQRRPALIGEGARGGLLSTMGNAKAVKVQGSTLVEVGSTLPYAGLMQWGGTSTQVVSSDAKKSLAKWMKSLRRKRNRIALYSAKSDAWLPAKDKVRKQIRKEKKRAKDRPKKGTPSKPRRGTGKAKNKLRSLKLGGRGQGAIDKQKAFKQVSNEINRANKLGFLFHKTKLTTKVNARPFLGTTPQLVRDIRELVEDWVQNYVSS